MAITIKSNTETNNFKHENVPATQGNVLSTINAYNDELKKKYYDKEQTRVDVNTLQSDIIKLIKQLAGNSALENFTEKPANTENEDGASDRIESYNGEFNESKELNYDEAGLIQKLSIIANLVSGNTKDIKKWDKGSTGNPVGTEKSTIATPVIGYTRSLDGEHKYTATIDIDDERKSHLTVGGLNTIKGEDGKDKEISDQTVLSEKQTAELIESCMITILEDYDTQLANLIGYLLFNSDDLPESYQYVLRHINEPYIGSAPLFAKFDSDKLVVHCVNSATGYNEQFIVFDDTESQQNGNWSLELDNNFSNIKVSYNDNDTTEFNYNIPVPMATLEIDHKILVNNEKPVVTVEGTFLGTKLTITQEDVLGDNKLYWNVPCGSKINISTSDLKLYDSNDKPFENATGYKILDNTKLHANVVKYVLKYDNDTDNSCTIEEWYKDDLTLNITLSDYTKTGYASNGTLKGGTITGNDLSINIKEPGLIEDKINWVVKRVTVTHNVEGQEPYTEDLDWFAPLSNPEDVQGKKFTGWKNINGMLVTEVSGDNGGNTMTVSTSLEEIKYKCTYVVGDVDVSHDGLVSEHTHDAGKIPTISRTGYTFDGWYTSPNFEGVNKTDNYKNEDATYYAKWIENSYTIKFNLSVPSLAEGANPYFKYGDVKVVTTNMPFTLGRPYATGYTFTGWYLSDAGDNELLNEINVTDFNGGKEITLYAKWEADIVKVLEEIYYQTDSQDGYDLMEVIENTGEPGGLYQTSGYTVMKGFEENTSKTTGNSSSLKATGNVIKRYFDRCSYNVTFIERLSGGTSSTNLQEYTKFIYSDNDKMLPVPNKVANGYTFKCWEDTNNSVFDKIDAYTHEDLTLHAVYNQDVPKESIDFEVTYEQDKFKIIKGKDLTKQLLVKDDTGYSVDISSNESYTFVKSSFGDVKNTRYATLYFNEDTDIFAEASKTISVPIKFKPTAIKENEDYKIDSIKRTVTPMDVENVPLEISYDGINFESLNDTKSVNAGVTFHLRKKETYMYIHSDAISTSVNGEKVSVSSEQLNALNDTDNFEIKEIEYEKPGEILIKYGAFTGNHGSLQYTLGKNGGAWIDINPNGTGEAQSATIYVDKPVDVYFRYGENDTYYSSTVSIPYSVKMKEITVNFTVNKKNVSELPTSDTHTFNGLTNGCLIINSGDQLCRCPYYVDNVNGWEISGYNKGDKGPRDLGFLKDENDKDFNEATIITEDKSLELVFKPIEWDNYMYSNSIEVNYGDINGSISLENRIFENLSEKTKKITYGEPIKLSFDKQITKYLSSVHIEVIEKITNVIDQNESLYEHMFDEINSVKYLNGNVWSDVGSGNWNPTYSFLSFTYIESDVPNFLKINKASQEPYVFRPVFSFKKVGNSSELAYQIAFTDLKNATSAKVGVINVPSGKPGNTKLPLVYTVTEKRDNTTDVLESQTLEVYYERDPRIANEGYEKIDDGIVLKGIYPEACNQIDVMFHSFFEDLGNDSFAFHPAKCFKNVDVRKTYMTSDDFEESVTVESDGVTINTKNGWSIE